MTREGKEKPFCKRGNVLYQCASLLKTGFSFHISKFLNQKFIYKLRVLRVIITYLSSNEDGHLNY